MPTDDDFMTREIKTPKTAMIGGIPKEYTHGGSRCKFVDNSGREVRITSATKNAEAVEWRRLVVKGFKRSFEVQCFGGVKVEQKRSSIEGFNPISWGHACLEK